MTVVEARVVGKAAARAVARAVATAAVRAVERAEAVTVAGAKGVEAMAAEATAVVGMVVGLAEEAREGAMVEVGMVVRPFPKEPATLLICSAAC